MPNTRNLSPEVHGTLKFSPIVAVLVANDPAVAVTAAQALVRGGIKAVELALRTPRALECIGAVVNEVREIQMIAGTVLNQAQLDDLARHESEGRVARA